MSDESDESLLERAFATGAQSVTVRSRAPYFEDYEASIDAFEVANDGEGRSASRGAHATGLGSTPSEALLAVLAKVTSDKAVDVLEENPRRYAVVGRPGQFVTRRELSAQYQRAMKVADRLDAIQAETAQSTGWSVPITRRIH